jgi:hypothetical protein
VSPFAAGCAICGTALDPNRGRRRSLLDQFRSGLPRLGTRVPARRRPR